VGAHSIGIDVGADRLHCVTLVDGAQLGEARLLDASQIGELGRWLEGTNAVVAIDAPARLSTAPHRDDSSLSPKFSVGRCAEIALGRDYGSWVPWVTPMGEPIQGWMATGFRVYGELASRGVETIEVYPHAGFRELVGRTKLPKKSTMPGLVRRIEALRDAGVETASLEMWSHDGLDALLAAVVARDYRAGSARCATCGHDGSGIWLPALL
jgi:predicted nuclease with RNAse H fold